MSRRNNAGFQGNNNSPNISQGSSGGGGGAKIPYGSLNIQLGKRGLTVSGQSVETITVPLKGKQTQSQQQQQPPFPWQGGNGGQGAPLLQQCILAVAQQGQIAQQQFALHQQAQATNQQLLTALTQYSASIGMAMPNQQMSRKQRKAYMNPQQQVQQTRQRTKQKSQTQNQQQFAVAGQ